MTLSPTMTARTWTRSKTRTRTTLLNSHMKPKWPRQLLRKTRRESLVETKKTLNRPMTNLKAVVEASFIPTPTRIETRVITPGTKALKMKMTMLVVITTDHKVTVKKERVITE